MNYVKNILTNNKHLMLAQISELEIQRDELPPTGINTGMGVSPIESRKAEILSRIRTFQRRVKEIELALEKI